MATFVPVRGVWRPMPYRCCFSQQQSGCTGLLEGRSRRQIQLTPALWAGPEASSTLALAHPDIGHSAMLGRVIRVIALLFAGVLLQKRQLYTFNDGLCIG